MPLQDFTGFNDWNELGVESIATDPVHPGKLWLAAGEYTEPFAVPLDGEILRSDNEGRSFQVTDLPIQLGSNLNGRNMGERLAVDPNDDNILYLASPANGLWRSTNGGVTWSQVTSFPLTSSPDDIGLSFVTFGPARRPPRHAHQDPLRRRRHRQRPVCVHRRRCLLAPGDRRAHGDGATARRDGRQRHLLR